ncbi:MULTISPECIES: hypothetical protein [Aeromonas]|uniref:Uncharacterized protein n=1 Tax=Aeromonas veronii TaxID=654 RepID=A0A4S5CCT7_AERVE|nr:MULTISPECIES: hypothetical protein [Aeromonas]THJ43604.1 hypothetical protein E8Q35_14960 [Aeromonas veronii]
MTESNKFPLEITLKEGSETVVSITEGSSSPITFIRLQTDTQVIHHRLHVYVSKLDEITGLSKSEVRELVANAPEDKIVSLDDEVLVRLPTAAKWNLPKLQSDDPDKAGLAHTFHELACKAIADPMAMQERSIAAAKVPEKSKKAKEQKRKDLKDAGLDQVCQLSQAPINGQATHIHHIKRVADAPELAAEQHNLQIVLVAAHQEEHKKDKTLPEPPTPDI